MAENEAEQAMSGNFITIKRWRNRIKRSAYIPSAPHPVLCSSTVSLFEPYHKIPNSRSVVKYGFERKLSDDRRLGILRACYIQSDEHIRDINSCQKWMSRH